MTGTGLVGRRPADRAVVLAAGAGPLCVAIADVDLFKGVNDRFGHFVGDEVLRRIAALPRDHVRDDDLVARFGGEEFLIGFDGLSLADAWARCEVLRARVAGFPWETVQAGLFVTISLGVAVVPAGGDLPAAMTLADRRLYDAKHDGRNQVAAG
jgi:diguanylate cyclase